MKTLKITIAAIALLFAGAAANAAEKPKTDKPTKDDVVHTYINAISTGDTKSLDKILGKGMEFNMKHGNTTSTMSKDKLLSAMADDVVTTPIKTTTTVMTDDGDTEKVKIVFNYDGYVRTDVVILDHTYGWAVNSITSTNN